MPEYFVRTNSDRVICIKADECLIDNFRTIYTFQTEGEPVATFNFRDILGVFQEAAYQGEFSAIDGNEDEDETDNVCIDCRNQELFDSEEFFSAVYDIVDGYHQADEDVPPTPPTDPLPIEHWKNDVTGYEYYGFHIEGKFVDFSRKDWAEEGRAKQLAGVPLNYWSYKDLTGYTKVED